MWTNLREVRTILEHLHKYEPVHEILVLITYAGSEGSDESAHTASLMRPFTSCKHKEEICR